MSVIDKSRLISWLDAQERCYAAELDKCRPTSNHYKSCQAKNEAFQAVILRINMGDFDDSQLAALKEENERLMRIHADVCVRAGDEITRLKAREAELEQRLENIFFEDLEEPANEGDHHA